MRPVRGCCPIFAVYVLVVLLASLFGVSPQRSLWSTYERMQGFVDLVHWFAFTWVLASVFRSWNDWRWLLNFNLGVSVFMGLLGLSQHYDVGVLDFLKASRRLDITLGNATYVGAYMMVNVLVAVGFLSRSFSSPRQPTPSRSAERRRRRRRRSATDEGIPAETIWLALWIAAVSLGALILAGNGAWSVLGALAVGLVAVAIAARQGVAPLEWWRVVWVAVAVLAVLVAFYVNGRVDFAALAVWLVALRAVYVKGDYKETSWRVFWLTAVMLGALILYLSGTRGALVGLAGGLIAFAAGYAMWGSLRQLRVASIVLIGLVLALGSVTVLVRDTAAFDNIAKSNPMLRRLGNTFQGDDSLEGRVNSATMGLRGFAARPLLGWGPENFTIAYDRYVTTDIVATAVTSFDQAHNKPIEELTTKGILGFLGYMAMWVFMVVIVARRIVRQNSQDQLFTLFAGAALAGYFVQNLFLFDTPGTGPQFYLLMGFIVYVDTATGPVKSESGPARTARERPQPDSGRGRMFLQSDGSLIAALVAMGFLVLLTIYLFNYRALEASRNILLTIDASLSWEERLVHFDRTVDGFPQLANYPRIVMFNQLTRQWDKLNPQEAEAALGAVDREGRKGIAREPEEWRLYLSLASLYHRAVQSDLGYRDRARSLIAAAAVLAPARIEVVQMQVQQHLIDSDYDAALGIIDRYLEKSPAAARHLKGLRDQVVKASGG